MWQTRNAYKILVWKSLENRSRGKQRHRWEDNIKIEFRGAVNWIETGQGMEYWRAFVKYVTCIQVV